MRIAGLDVGFSKTRKSTGVAILGDGTLIVERMSGIERACDALSTRRSFDCIAIDGPIPSTRVSPSDRRSVESLFQRGIFQRRCKPGASHVRGTGQTFRATARTCAARLAPYVAAAVDIDPHSPSVHRVIEAFPNAFLGVSVSDDDYRRAPKLRRGKKFDWLYTRWTEGDILGTLPGLTPEDVELLTPRFVATTNHDERAALVCLLTALLVVRGHFSAVGDTAGGWFFLPPLAAWESWAREGLDTEVRRLKDEGHDIDIWDGWRRVDV